MGVACRREIKALDGWRTDFSAILYEKWVYVLFLHERQRGRQKDEGQ